MSQIIISYIFLIVKKIATDISFIDIRKNLPTEKKEGIRNISINIIGDEGKK